MRPFRPPPRMLAPAPPRAILHREPPKQGDGPASFYSLPPEIRLEIYNLCFATTEIWITPVPIQGTPPPLITHPQRESSQPTDPLSLLANTAANHQPPPEYPNYYQSTSTSHHTNPPTTTTTYHPKPRQTPNPHPLTLTSHLIRNETQSLILTTCPIHATITNFDFTPLLVYLNRIPPDEQKFLTRNPNLHIDLRITATEGLGALESLRKWLHLRADEYRPQGDWHYKGLRPGTRVVNDLRRRVRRMKKEVGKRKEFVVMLEGLGVHCT